MNKIAFTFLLFIAYQPEQLAKAISEWLTLFGQNNHPKSDAMPWLTWEQSAESLISLVL